MTHSGGQPHAVGDRGQRYEVSYLNRPDWDDDGERLIFGWSDTLEGAKQMCGSISKHPVWTDPEIQDRTLVEDKQ